MFPLGGGNRVSFWEVGVVPHWQVAGLTVCPSGTWGSAPLAGGRFDRVSLLEVGTEYPSGRWGQCTLAGGTDVPLGCGDRVSLWEVRIKCLFKRCDCTVTVTIYSITQYTEHFRNNTICL